MVSRLRASGNSKMQIQIITSSVRIAGGTRDNTA
jgi:hypothetical protein